MLLAALFVASPLFGIALFLAHAAAVRIKTLDSDSDGTVSLDEAQVAATTKFEMRDPDKDDTLDTKDAKGLMSASTFKTADPDNDGTIDKTEYAASVTAAFAKTDPGSNGTLDAKELPRPAGHSLVKLIQYAVNAVHDRSHRRLAFARSAYKPQ